MDFDRLVYLTQQQSSGEGKGVEAGQIESEDGDGCSARVEETERIDELVEEGVSE